MYPVSLSSIAGERQMTGWMGSDGMGQMGCGTWDGTDGV